MAADALNPDFDLDVDDYEEVGPTVLDPMCGVTNCCSEGCANPSCD